MTVMAACLIPVSIQSYNHGSSQVRKYLHVVLCFSPVGDKFRVRARQFPALVNCMVYDWFLPWPSQVRRWVWIFAVAFEFSFAPIPLAMLGHVTTQCTSHAPSHVVTKSVPKAKIFQVHRLSQFESVPALQHGAFWADVQHIVALGCKSTLMLLCCRHWCRWQHAS